MVNSPLQQSQPDRFFRPAVSTGELTTRATPAGTPGAAIPGMSRRDSGAQTAEVYPLPIAAG